MTTESNPALAEDAPPAAAVPFWQRCPAVAIALTVVFLSVLATPLVRSSERLTWTIAGVGAVLLAWEAILWATAKGRTFAVQFVAIRAHYVQAAVQLCIYVYWGWHSSGVAPEFQLIFAQIVFLYTLSALLAWSRGRTWEMGFGPLPIIFSTNLLMWFKHDFYYYQFAMVAVGALGKEFVRWRRDGRMTHIFNPSVFGQSIAGLILIATGTTTYYTLGEEIAVSFESLPHIFVLLFVLGLVVQSLFAVTLVTLSAVTTLIALNSMYTHETGTYWFVTINIGATVFLGMHLLLTDPSTSPKTYLGKVIFGALYACGYFTLFRVFNDNGIAVFWDKLLPVPILNLCVKMFDRFTRSGVLGWIDRAWENALSKPKLNLVHMGVWTAVFAAMLGTGYVQGDQERRQLGFWRQQYVEGKSHAGQNLLDLTKGGMDAGSGEAFNTYGELCLEGKLVPKDEGLAAASFARACELEWPQGCVSVAMLYLYGTPRRAHTPEAVKLAFDHLEQLCATGFTGQADALLARAYETGDGRPIDPKRALALFETACGKGEFEGCRGVARVTMHNSGLSGPLTERAIERLAQSLYDDARKKAGK